MTNPLLEEHSLPPFSSISPNHVEPAVDAILADNRERLRSLLDSGTERWEGLMSPLEDMNDRLHQAWWPVRHMNAVVNSDDLRAAYNACLPKISAYSTELGQNASLFRVIRQLVDKADADNLDSAQRKALELGLRDFRLSGIDLPAEQQARFKEIAQKLSTLQAKFDENVLDATNAWRKHVTDPDQLSGVPESALGMLSQNAAREGKDGWMLTLEPPSYIAIMTYADKAGLREEVYQAYATRASDQGPGAGQFDNSNLIENIMALRHEMAALLGFANYSERSLETKMAETPLEVTKFLYDLARRARPQAVAEFAALGVFAKEFHGIDSLDPWDVSYYSEKLRQQRYAVSQEMLRPYFPEQRVVAGMFAVAERLYGLKIEALDGVDTWHPDVCVYQLRDRAGHPSARFYMDLYARPQKRGGAWMDDFRGRRRLNDGLQTPVASITCNFTPPVGERPALFTHEEVVTLFHEFGHALHHMLTRVDYLEVSGINGVEWDAVELPSQFMENWCWERDALDLISGHFETEEPIPDDLYRRMIEARNFHSAMMMVRQLEFALFDLRLHSEYDPNRGARVMEIWSEVRNRVAVTPVPAYHRFPHAFSHIFAGGYAAGYYSYKWAEVLSADAFSKFEERGIFDRATGEEFLHSVLEMGGSRDSMKNFVEFRGRKPSIDPLIRHSGIGG